MAYEKRHSPITVAGAAADFGLTPGTAFPINPLSGNLQRLGFNATSDLIPLQRTTSLILSDAGFEEILLLT